jgi:hypothetical protein
MKIFGIWVMLSLGIGTAGAASITEKCLKPFEDALGKLIDEKVEQKPVPVECQYYKFSDLSPELQKKVKEHISPKALEISPTTPLSAIFGTMVNGSSHPAFLNSQCTEIMDHFEQQIGMRKTWAYCTSMYDKLMNEMKYAGCLTPIIQERLNSKRSQRCDKLGKPVP